MWSRQREGRPEATLVKAEQNPFFGVSVRILLLPITFQFQGPAAGTHPPFPQPISSSGNHRRESQGQSWQTSYSQHPGNPASILETNTELLSCHSQALDSCSSQAGLGKVLSENASARTNKWECLMRSWNWPALGLRTSFHLFSPVSVENFNIWANFTVDSLLSCLYSDAL